MINNAVLNAAKKPAPSLLSRLLEERCPTPRADDRYARIPVTLIQECVAHANGYSLERLLAHGKDEPRAHVRQLAMYLCTELTNSSLHLIARAFRKRDHTTISHARDKVRSALTTDTKVAKSVATLRTLIQGVHHDLRDAAEDDPCALALLQKI